MELEYDIEEEFKKIDAEYGLRDKDKERAMAIEVLTNRCFEKARQNFLGDPYTRATISVAVVGSSVKVSLKRG